MIRRRAFLLGGSILAGMGASPHQRDYLLLGRQGGLPPVVSQSFLTPGILDPAWTFTRASTNGTYFDASGVMRNATINLALQSVDFTSSSWTKTACTLAAGIAGPNGNPTGSGVIPNAGVIGVLQQGWVNTAATITMSVFVRAGTQPTVVMLMPSGWWADAQFRTADFNLAAGTIGTVAGAGASAAIAPAGNGWYRISLTATPNIAAGAGSPHFVRSGVNGDGTSVHFYAWGAQLEAGSVATPLITTTTLAAGGPRWDYDPGTKQLNGLLLEEARTNSIRNSMAVGAVPGSPGTMPTNWAVTALGLTPQVIGTGTEDGIAYIDVRLSGTVVGGNNPTITFEAINAAAVQSQLWTLSFNCKLIAGTLVNGVAPMIFSYATGLVFLNAYVGPVRVPTNAGLAAQRMAGTATITDATVAFLRPFLQFLIPNGSTVDFTIRIGAPQLELGSYVTSFIPTTTVVVTRARDALSVPAPGAWYDATKGSMSFEHIPRGAGAFSSPAQLVGAAAGTDFIDCVGYTTTGTVPGVSYVLGAHNQKVGGVTQVQAAFSGTSSVAVNVIHRHAVSWDLGNGARAAVDGVNAVPGNPPAPAALPTITSLTLAGVANNQPQVSLWARKFQYWNRQLSQNHLNRVSLGLP